MSDDVEHLWRLVGVEVEPGVGQVTDYECELCVARLRVGPGELHPPVA